MSDRTTPRTASDAPPVDVPTVGPRSPQLGDLVLYALPQKEEAVALVVSVGQDDTGKPLAGLHVFTDLNNHQKAALEMACVQLGQAHFYVATVRWNPTAEWVQHTWRYRD